MKSMTANRMNEREKAFRTNKKLSSKKIIKSLFRKKILFHKNTFFFFFLHFPHDFVNLLGLLWPPCYYRQRDRISFRLRRRLVCVLHLQLLQVLHVDFSLERRHAIHEVALHALQALEDFREETYSFWM